jgi:hypothetical protein
VPRRPTVPIPTTATSASSMTSRMTSAGDPRSTWLTVSATPASSAIATTSSTASVAAPDSVFTVLDPVLSFYEGNELLFLSGFLFGIAQDEFRGGE